MCGIAGLVSSSPLTPDDHAIVRRMQANMVHRGPDGEGWFDDGPYAGCMRRLAIIDVDGSPQPLKSQDGRYVLFFNGEIYNYREMRAQLMAKGYSFGTEGDGETIIHLYREYGLDFPKYLRGMFAIALWDREARQLILARDRFGEKPLYLYKSQNAVLFASEMKSLMASGVINPELNPQAVHQFFHLNFVIDPLTMLAAVEKLPPANVWRIDADGLKIEKETYWTLLDAETIDDRPEERILDSLHEALHFTLRSDRPVALALSGGLDSSAVAAIASRYHGESLTAISVGYDASEREADASDERMQARELAEHLGIAFHDVEIGRTDVIAQFPDLVMAMDDPIADISGSGYAAVARKAQELDIPVLLFGMGGDELFAGYPWMLGAIRTIARMQRWAESGSNHGHMVRTGGCQKGRDALFAQFDAWSQKPETAPFWSFSLDHQRAAERLPGLLEPQFAAAIKDTASSSDPMEIDLAAGRGQKPALLAAQAISSSYLIGNGVPQADRLGMAHSVEARQPFLDHHFVETVIAAQKALPTYPPEGKKLLKRILEPELPAEVLARRKRGFRPPAAEWFQALIKEYGSRIPDGILAKGKVFTPETIDTFTLGAPEARIAMPMYFKALVLTLWFEGIEKIAADKQAGDQATAAMAK